MILYHGSKSKLDFLEKRQAKAAEGVQVPADELLNAIYLTPEFEFALACAVRPPGVTKIGYGKITFEHPELFDPDAMVYVYEIDTDDLPESHLRRVDERQFVITEADTVIPKAIKAHRAEEILKYFELTNWKQEDSEVMRSNEQKPRLR